MLAADFAKNLVIPAQAGIHGSAGLALPEEAPSSKPLKISCLLNHRSRPSPG
jgi:hypothetical protein